VTKTPRGVDQRQRLRPGGAPGSERGPPCPRGLSRWSRS